MSYGYDISILIIMYSNHLSAAICWLNLLSLVMLMNKSHRNMVNTLIGKSAQVEGFICDYIWPICNAYISRLILYNMFNKFKGQHTINLTMAHELIRQNHILICLKVESSKGRWRCFCGWPCIKPDSRPWDTASTV